MLTVIQRAGDILYPNGKKVVQWQCRCDCGAIITARASNLKRDADLKSCGCIRADAASRRFRRHGFSGTRVHLIWKLMRKRCRNENDPNYPKYGGRGIRVCPEWDSFEAFFADMGHPPSARHSLDRIDNNGNYEAKNW